MLSQKVKSKEPNYHIIKLGSVLLLFVLVGCVPSVDNPQKTDITAYVTETNILLTPTSRKNPNLISTPEPKTSPIVTEGTTAISETLVFSSNRNGTSDIFIMSRNGDHVKNLTNDEYENLYPAWSPDGYKIIFSSNRDGNFDIYSINADGSGLERIINTMADDVEPIWLNNGKYITFLSHFRDEDYISVYSVDDNRLITAFNVLEIYSGSTVEIDDVCCLSWSADGQWFSITMTVDSMSRELERSVHIISIDDLYFYRIGGYWRQYLPTCCISWNTIDTQNFAFVSVLGENSRIHIDRISDLQNLGLWQHGVTVSIGGERIRSGLQGAMYLDWSPSNKWISFQSNKTGNYDIYTISKDGSTQRNLTNHPAEDTGAKWMPMGQTTSITPIDLSSLGVKKVGIRNQWRRKSLPFDTSFEYPVTFDRKSFHWCSFVSDSNISSNKDWHANFAEGIDLYISEADDSDFSKMVESRLVDQELEIFREFFTTGNGIEAIQIKYLSNESSDLVISTFFLMEKADERWLFEAILSENSGFCDLGNDLSVSKIYDHLLQTFTFDG